MFSADRVILICIFYIRNLNRAAVARTLALAASSTAARLRMKNAAALAGGKLVLASSFGSFTFEVLRHGRCGPLPCNLAATHSLWHAFAQVLARYADHRLDSMANLLEEAQSRGGQTNALFLDAKPLRKRPCQVAGIIPMAAIFLLTAWRPPSTSWNPTCAHLGCSWLVLSCSGAGRRARVLGLVPRWPQRCAGGVFSLNKHFALSGGRLRKRRRGSPAKSGFTVSPRLGQRIQVGCILN